MFHGFLRVPNQAFSFVVMKLIKERLKWKKDWEKKRKKNKIKKRKKRKRNDDGNDYSDTSFLLYIHTEYICYVCLCSREYNFIETVQEAIRLCVYFIFHRAENVNDFCDFK